MSNTIRFLEGTIFTWWDNLTIETQKELTEKYYPKFHLEMMDSYEIEHVYNKEIANENETEI